jgi:hypothetical protein
VGEWLVLGADRTISGIHDDHPCPEHSWDRITWCVVPNYSMAAWVAGRIGALYRTVVLRFLSFSPSLLLSFSL